MRYQKIFQRLRGTSRLEPDVYLLRKVLGARYSVPRYLPLLAFEAWHATARPLLPCFSGSTSCLVRMSLVALDIREGRLVFFENQR